MNGMQDMEPRFAQSMIESWINSSSERDLNKILIRLSLRSICGFGKEPNLLGASLPIVFRFLVRYIDMIDDFDEASLERVFSAHQSLLNFRNNTTSKTSKLLAHSIALTAPYDVGEAKAKINRLSSIMQAPALISQTHVVSKDIASQYLNISRKLCCSDMRDMGCPNKMDIYQVPLWREDGVPAALKWHEEVVRDYMSAPDSGLTFWSSWYGGYRAGRPIDGYICSQVARIPDHKWESGLDNLNLIISEIQCALNVEARLEELVRNIHFWSDASENIKGNGPPLHYSEIGDNSQIVAEIASLHEDIKSIVRKEVRSELDAREAEHRLQTFLKRFTDWYLKKVDLAIDALIKAYVPLAAGGVAASLIFLERNRISALIDSIEAWKFVLAGSLSG